MAIELGGEKFDREDMRFFKGTRRACTIRLFGLANCCRNDGLLEGLAGCSASERELARERNEGNTHYLGKRCAKKTFFGVCIRRETGLVHVRLQARAHPAGAGPQADRQGLERLQRLHRRRDREHRLRQPSTSPEFTGNMMDGDMEPDVSLPDAADTGAAMRTRPSGNSISGASDGARCETVPEMVPDTHPGGGRYRDTPGRGGRAARAGRGMAVVVPRIGSGASGGFGSDPRLALLLRPAGGSGRSAAVSRAAFRRRHTIGDGAHHWRCARRWKSSRASAILDPTPEKVAAYLRLQQETLQRAAAFSDAFRRTVWATPELDYTLKRPVGALAKRLWSDGRRADVAASLAKLGERYGLIYLGHTGCAGCRVFGPLLRAFALRHGLDVLGGVAHRRAARRLARGGAGQRARRKARPRRHAGPRPGAVRHQDQARSAGRLRRHGRGPDGRTDIHPHRPGSPAMDY